MVRLGKGTRRPTLKDVAALAGVSPITVSRAIREPGRVSPDLRQRIERTIHKLDYVPDQNASALASTRTNVIGVLIPSLTNIVFADVLRGMYDAVENSPFQIQIANTRYSPLEEERMLRVFLTQRPAAVIMTGIDQTGASRDLLARCDRPVVQIMEKTADPVDMLVGFSHFEASRALTRHMLSVGYRRIGYLAARLDPRTQRRIQGYQDALREAGCADPKLLTATPASSSMTLGRDMFRDLFGRHPDVDAVLCNNDDLAFGALFECQRSGIRVPDQVGIAGFNDIEGTAITCPSLTTVRTPRYEIGRQAIEMAIAAVGGLPAASKSVDLGYEIMPRESTRAPRPAAQSANISP